MRLGKLLAGISALCVLAGGTALAQDKPFAGVTVNVFTQTGAGMAEAWRASRQACTRCGRLCLPCRARNAEATLRRHFETV